MIETVTVHEFNRRLREKAAGQNRLYTVTMEVTYGCNLRCVHCFNPTHKALPRELPLENLRTVIRELAALGCARIDFTGGEVFTRRGVLDLMHEVRGLGMQFGVLTNATLLDDNTLQILEDLKPSEVSVSVYGMTRETYEAVTQTPGSFAKFWQGIERLRQSKLPLHFKMPVMTLNRHELEQAYAWFRQAGLPFVHTTEIHPRVNGDLEPLRYRLPAEEAAALRMRYDEEICCVRREAPLENPRKTKNKVFSCACGVDSAAVTPYGEMNLCVANPYPHYALQTGNVQEGWKLLADFVRGEKPADNFECSRCEVASYCTQGANDSYLEKRDWNACLPYFKAVASRIHDAQIHKEANGA